MKGFAGQVQHYCGVFPDGIEHDRVVELGCNFPDDVDAFSFQLFEMRQVVSGHRVLLPLCVPPDSIEAGRVNAAMIPDQAMA